MTQIIGPYVSQVTEKPLIVIEDSRKNEDAISLKVAGEFGATEFSLENIAEIHKTLTDFLQIKGANPSIESQAAAWVRDAKERGIDISVSH